MTQSVRDQASHRPETPILATQPCPLTVRSFGLTDPGLVRDSNEDQFLIAELTRTLWVHQTSVPQSPTHHGRNRGHIFLVADGMGGHQAGEVASALTVASIEAFVLHILHRFSNLEVSDEQTVIKDLQAALRHADACLFEQAAHHPEFVGMGTTLTMAFATGRKLFVIHAGDSRCYLFRGGKLQQLTLDQTVAAELARNGVIKPEQVSRHPFRHNVTNFLGDRKRSEPGVQVEVHMTNLEKGDEVLLSSDGLTDMVADNQIAALLAAERDPRLACERLVAAANAQGGMDNITAIVARIETV